MCSITHDQLYKIFQNSFPNFNSYFWKFSCILYAFTIYLKPFYVLLKLIFQLFSEGKLYSSTSLIVSKYCISYRSHPASRRNLRAHPGAKRGFFFWSSGQCCRTNRSSELWFGRAKIHWPYRYFYRQAPVHNPIISNYTTIVMIYLCI